MAKKIYLSPSSQWGNPYSFGDYTEAEVCGIIAQYAKSALERNGYEVKLGDHVDTDMYGRTRESNAWGADYHVPIHTNAGGGEGTVVFVSSASANDKYVKAVYNALAAVSPGKDRNVRVNDGLYEINSTKAVCIYTETEFHDNANLAKWIVENVETIGEAFAKGFCAADGKTYKAADGMAEEDEIPEPTPTQEPKKDLGNVDVIYQAFTDRWWPVVKNNEDWAGKDDKVPLRFLAICVSKGKIRGRVHTIKDGWLPYLTFGDSYDLKDLENGVLGNGNPIDAIELYYYTPDGYLYKRVAYRASDLNNEAFFAIQYDNETSGNQDGYAGLFGVAIDKFQAWIV